MYTRGVYEISAAGGGLPPQIPKKQKEGYTPENISKTGILTPKSGKSGYTLLVEGF